MLKNEIIKKFEDVIDEYVNYYSHNVSEALKILVKDLNEYLEIRHNFVLRKPVVLREDLDGVVETFKKAINKL